MAKPQAPPPEPVRIPPGQDSLLAQALDRAPDAVFGILPSSAFFYVNDAACRALGCSREELLQSRVADVDPRFPAEAWPAHWAQVRQDGGMSLETVHRHKDGHEYPVEVSTRILTLDGQERMFAYARDLSARKAAEAARRSSEEKYQRAFQVSPDAIAITRLADGTYLEVGEGFSATFGWSPEEVLGRTSPELGLWVRPEDRLRLVAAVRRGQASSGLEFEFRRKDGSRFTGLLSSSALELDGEACLLSVTRDITGRKRMEEALRDREGQARRTSDLLRAVLESPQGIIVFSLDGEYRYTAFTHSHAETMRRIWGVDIAAGMNMLEAIRSPADRAQAKACFDRALAGEQFTLEEEYGDSDRCRSHWENRYGPIREAGGAITGLTVFVTDISARRQVEGALRESEARYRHLFETMAQGVVYQDAEGRIITANPSAARILGLSQEQLLGRTSLDPRWQSIRPDGTPLEGPDHPAMRALRSGQPVLNELMGVFHPGEMRYRWMLVSAIPEPCRGAARPGLVCATFTDITEQKQAQDELRAAERRLHTVVSNSQAVIYQLDGEGRFLLSEGLGLEGLGLRPGQVVGSSAFAVYRGHPQILDQLARSLRGEAVHEVTELSGMVFDHQLSPVLDAQGRTESVIGIATDITARTRAEDALRDSEARFRAVWEYEPECVVLVAEDGTLLDLNPAGLAMVEVADRDEAVGGSLFDIVAKEWRGAFRDLLDKVFRGETVQEGFEIVGVKGTRRFTETHAVPLRRPDFRVTSMLAVIRDVTARNRAEEELRASESRYRALYEKTPVMLHSIEMGGHLLNVSDLWLSRMGYTRKEVLGRPSSEFMTEQSRRFAREKALPDFFRTGTCSNVPYQFVTRGGEVIDVLLSATAERDEDGAVQNSLAVLVDVTEQKRALDALRRSEAKFGALFEAMTEGVALHELVRDASGGPADYRVLDVNPGFEFHLGISTHRAKGALASELYGLGRPPYLDVYAEAVDSGRASVFETYFPPLGKHLRISVVPLDRGHFATIFEDVTDQITRIEALRESEASYRGLFDGVHEAIYIQDANARFVDVNRGAREMYGYEREDFIGRTPEFLSAPGLNDLGAVAARIQRAFAGEPQQFEFWGLRRNGEVFPKEVRVYPGTYFGQNVVVALSIDISERRRSEEALRQAQKLESLGVLAGGIAHDFNNLLTAMMGNLNLAQAKLPALAPAQSYLDAVERTVIKASDLTKQMLAYSGKGRFVVQAQDLNLLVREMMHLLNVSISKKAELAIDLQEGLPAIMAEAAQIQQVVMNLVTNAADALGSVPGSIRVSTRLERLEAAAIQRHFANQELEPGDYVVLEVADTGCGIPEEVLGRIFDPFFTTKTSGRGLGLSALLGILRGHKAGIRIHSEVGKGSTFSVCFPASAEAAAAAPGAAASRDGTLSGTVLLVDDEEMILESTGMALESLGFTVLTARDGVEGVERFLEHGPGLSLVLMDLSMPRMDGVTAFLAMHQAHPDIPVLLSSGYDPQEPGEDLLAKGLAGFIQKPYRLKDLANTVVAALERKPPA